MGHCLLMSNFDAKKNYGVKQSARLIAYTYTATYSMTSASSLCLLCWHQEYPCAVETMYFSDEVSSVTLWRNNVFHSLSKHYFPEFYLAWLSHVKLLKVNLVLFVSRILIKSHRQPCGHQLRWKLSKLAHFASPAFVQCLQQFAKLHSDKYFTTLPQPF